MHLVRPPSAALLLLFELASSLALAQSPSAAPSAANAPPKATVAASQPTAPAPPAPTPAKPAPATPAPAASRPSATTASAPSQAPQRAHRKKKGGHKHKKQTKTPDGPVATYPGFRMLPDGTSRVFVQVSRKVDVSESKAEGRVVYRMKGAQAIQTNRFPLVTTFFPTPVAKVQLVNQGDDLDMVIDLRTKSDVQHQVLETDAGIVLQVDFPKLPAGTQLTASVPENPPPTDKKRRRAAAANDDNAMPDESF